MLIFLIALLSFANITLAQKDSVLKVLKIQEYILETIDKHASIIQEESDSLNVLLKHTDEVLFLVNQSKEIPKRKKKAKKIISKVVFDALFEQGSVKEEMLPKIKSIVLTNLLISMNIDEQNKICGMIIDEIDYSKQSEEVKKLLEKTHSNEYLINQKFIENYKQNLLIAEKFKEFEKKDQLLLKQMF